MTDTSRREAQRRLRQRNYVVNKALGASPRSQWIPPKPLRDSNAARNAKRAAARAAKQRAKGIIPGSAWEPKGGRGTGKRIVVDRTVHGMIR